MTTTKLLSSIALIFLFTSASNSQTLHVRAGLNIASMHVKMGGDKVDDLQSRLGFQLGVLGELGSETIKLEVGLLFTQKGYKYDQTLPLIG